MAAEALFLDLSLTAWRVREMEPKPGALAPHLAVLLFEAGERRGWLPFPRNVLRFLSARELRELLPNVKWLSRKATPRGGS